MDWTSFIDPQLLSTQSSTTLMVSESRIECTSSDTLPPTETDHPSRFVDGTAHCGSAFDQQTDVALDDDTISENKLAGESRIEISQTSLANTPMLRRQESDTGNGPTAIVPTARVLRLSRRADRRVIRQRSLTLLRRVLGASNYSSTVSQAIRRLEKIGRSLSYRLQNLKFGWSHISAELTVEVLWRRVTRRIHDLARMLQRFPHKTKRLKVIEKAVMWCEGAQAAVRDTESQVLELRKGGDKTFAQMNECLRGHEGKLLVEKMRLDLIFPELRSYLIRLLLYTQTNVLRTELGKFGDASTTRGIGK